MATPHVASARTRRYRYAALVAIVAVALSALPAWASSSPGIVEAPLAEPTVATPTATTLDAVPALVSGPFAVTGHVHPVPQAIGGFIPALSFEVDGSIAGAAPIQGDGSGTTELSLPPGTYEIVASYGGNEEYGPSRSTPQTVEVRVATTTTLTTSHNPALSMQTVTLTASVSSTQATTLAGGVLTITDTSLGVQLASVPVGADATTLTVTRYLSVGSHALRADYSGYGLVLASQSSTVAQSVTRGGVSAGWYHTCALQSNSQIDCWGDAEDGATIVPAGTYRTVSAGAAFTCAVKANDALACWGYNGSGKATPPAGSFVQVSAGGDHACGVKTGGTVSCWGSNTYGQASPPTGTFTMVSAGFRTTCAVRMTNGALACWGSSEDGLTTPPVGAYASVSVGAFHSCAVRTNGGVACWGYGGDGQTDPPADTFSEVGGGVWHACGLRIEGTLACWGYDGDGQASPPSGEYIAATAGAWHSCAMTVDRSTRCWGWNYYNQAMPSEPAATTYVPVAPTRLLDSRSGNGLSGKFKANAARSFKVAGRGPVPANAVAVTGNFTVTRQTGAGYGSLTPVAINQPSTSTINFPVGDNRANNVTVALGPTGQLGAVYRAASGKTADFLFDVTGYFVADESAATYKPADPVRLLDTRVANGLTGRFVSGRPRTWQISGRGGIPSDATAITGNVTVVGQTSGGYLSISPVATANPKTSTLNFPLGDTRANGLTVKLADDGSLSAVFKASTGKTTHLILDVTGYYVDDGSGARFYPLDPDRLLDSRSDIGLVDKFKANAGRTLITAARVGVPGSAIAVTGNLTVVGQSKSGYVSMTKATTNAPLTSTLNFPLRDVRANGVTGPLSGSGTVGLVYKASSGATSDLILDISGYFRSPSDVTGAGSPDPSIRSPRAPGHPPVQDRRLAVASERSGGLREMSAAASCRVFVGRRG